MPIESFSTLATGRQAVGGAGGVGDDRVLGRQLVVIDAVDDGEIDALGRRRDQHALGAGVEMLLGALAVGEEAGAFERDVDIVRGMRELGGSRSA
jgi:hypothetical protein